MMEALGLSKLVLPPEGLETKVSHMGSQPCLHDRDSVKGLKSKAPESYPGWHYSVRLPNITARRVSIVHDYQERTTGISMCTSFPWPLPQTSLLLVDFDLYPFTEINYKCEFNNFQ